MSLTSYRHSLGATCLFLRVRLCHRMGIRTGWQLLRFRPISSVHGFGRISLRSRPWLTASPSPECFKSICLRHRLHIRLAVPEAHAYVLTRRRVRGELEPFEFISIKSLAATGSNAPGSCVGHSRVPSPDREHPPSHKRMRSFTIRQRLTLLLTCSIRSRRWWSAWLARSCSRVSSPPRGFFIGMRISTWGSVNDRKPRACNNPLPAGSG